MIQLLPQPTVLRGRRLFPQLQCLVSHAARETGEQGWEGGELRRVPEFPSQTASLPVLPTPACFHLHRTSAWSALFLFAVTWVHAVYNV